ncbi:type I-E CRISPR-associated protein Cas6/Cse3/CasE [Knoellia koreensis]|uniref:Type I-E CRISPR-associated protein Cas6/Cse3/CasE n=1 Tax=Knoellia koreensis TaxID=2730921 RepID=A0A849HPA1_9MICO|nr:type I-E CRISPR-associated protein Cas6/Cse3/CasE [Knoellia sp. DB2414S]NNM46437.1 type I-E CRISPR-associated protein Cas6/Cse3/CasE [Knoellia sp. DB2414S]
MPYLSKIQLNPLRQGTQRLLANPQRTHAAVLGGMPPGSSGRVLWRDEVTKGEVAGPARPELLVLTPQMPDWSHLVEQAGWATPEGAPLVRSLDPLLDLVVDGREFGFRVRANPTTSVAKPQSPTAAQRKALDDGLRRRGIRVAHRTAGHQLEWFLARTREDDTAWGFAVLGDEDHPHVSLVAREHISFSKGRETRHKVTLDRATFEGRLIVTDADRLREVLVGGLGRGKAYGCGLLTLAPVNGHVVDR